MRKRTVIISSSLGIVLILAIVVVVIVYNHSKTTDDIFKVNVPGKDLSPSGLILAQLEENADTTFLINLNTELPRIKTKVHLKLDTTAERTLLIYTFSFTNLADDSLLQTIIDTSNTDMTTEVIFNDFNFDGSLDFETIVDVDGVGNSARHFWVFDNALKRFIFNTPLSEEIVGEMTYDFRTKTIGMGARTGMTGESKEFQYINGLLTLVERQSDERVTINDSEKTKTTVEKLIDGKLKVVEETYSE
jgi:hypothetical protein